MARKTNKRWIARLRCVVIKEYTIEAADEDEARANMEAFEVDDEIELEQVDFEIQSIRQEKP